MTWRDDEHEPGSDSPWRDFGRPGGDFHGLRPSLDNPLTWAFKLFRTGGITVRIHAVFIIFIIIALLRSLVTPEAGAQQPLSLSITAIAMASLFILVLVHEFGHCLACRWVGGEADEILMWPLGGLAYCHPPNQWAGHLITAVGGPAVNVIVCIVTGATLWIATGEFFGIALPNPLNPAAGLSVFAVQTSIARMTLYLINMISFMLLLFNLLPIFPLDGGRIVQAVLWSRMGYSRSMRYAVRTGFIGAVLLVIFGAVIGNWWIVAIAIFGAAICYVTLKQVEFTDEFMGWSSDEPVGSMVGEAEEEHSSGRATPLKKWRDRREEKRQQQDLEDEQAIDAILQKIAAQGMESLSRAERKRLRRATERKRQRQQ